MASSRSANTQTTPRHLASLVTKRSVSLVSMFLVGALGLTACGPSYDDPTTAAEQLGTYLESNQLESFEDVSLAAGSTEPAEIAESTAALENYPVTLILNSVSVDEEEQAQDDEATTARAEYTVTWDLSGGSDSAAQDDADNWSYTTEATLFWDDETEIWRPQLKADTLVPGLVDGGRVDVEVDAAQRGDILDIHGEPLATERPVQRIGIDKTHILNDLAAAGTDSTEDDVEEVFTASGTDLAEALDLDPETFVDRVLAAGERAWVEFIVLRNDDETEIPTEEIGEIAGAVAIPDTMVLGPTATFARSILGAYGQPSAEQIEDSDGELIAGQESGLSGLQRTYNDQLAGTDGMEIFVDNSGTESSDTAGSTPVSFSRAATDGTPITTTLDTDIQELAEQSIADSEVPAGMVAIRPSDGHILAAAEGPEDLTWPLAMTSSYAPGSTFKVVTALAMVRNGITPESTVQCPATINVGGLDISNFDEYPAEYVGDITLAEAIAQSCNTTFVGQYQDISPEQEHNAAAALGLVQDPVVGFDGAFLGSVPTDVDDTTHAAGLFGQGSIEASPLGMATVAASVSAGETVHPVLISEPNVDQNENENLPVNEPLTEVEAEHLRQLMAGPVQDGTVPILQDVPGAPVLAKTGTAESEADGEAIAHTWLIATQDDIAVALFFHDGVAGAQTNGPVVQEFLTELHELSSAE